MSEQSYEEKIDKDFHDRMGLREERPGEFSGTLISGYIDAEGKVQRQFHIRELTGAEEDILASRGGGASKLNRVIANCIIQLGPETSPATVARLVRNLTAADRELLLIAIRRASFGSLWDANMNCPQCGKQSHITINLAKLERTEMPEPTKREYVELFDSGTQIGWHVLSCNDEEWLEEWRAKLEGKDLMSLAILSRVDYINDEKIEKSSTRDVEKALKSVQTLRMRDRNALRESFLSREGHLDTEVEFQCPHCNRESKTGLPFGPDFFSLRGM